MIFLRVGTSAASSSDTRAAIEAVTGMAFCPYGFSWAKRSGRPAAIPLRRRHSAGLPRSHRLGLLFMRAIK